MFRRQWPRRKCIYRGLADLSVLHVFMGYGNPDIPGDRKKCCFGCVVVTKAGLPEFIEWKWGEKVEIVHVIASFRHLYGDKKTIVQEYKEGTWLREGIFWRLNRNLDMYIGCKRNSRRVIGLMEQSSEKKQKMKGLDVKGSGEWTMLLWGGLHYSLTFSTRSGIRMIII